MDNRILKNSAHQKLSTEKPLINSSAKRIIIAFITSKNSPKVKMVAGNVKITKIGFTSKFKIESTMATIKAPK